MIKKWSYVAAAMLTVASGLALTSCIDNDEPFGIREIRQATANLLEAKKAAVEAEAAAKSAQVEIAKINAEIEKLRIENEKIMAEANAKIAEAEAKKIEAEGQAELLRAQGEKAVSDAEAAKLLAEADAKAKEADMWQAQADAIRMDAQGRYEKIQQEIAEAQQTAAEEQRKADYFYELAVYLFEKKKAENAEEWNNTTLWPKVQQAFVDYLWSIGEFNKANQQYQQALNCMAEIEADLIWIGKNETIQLPVWDVANKKWTTKNYTAQESGFISPGYLKQKGLLDLIANKESEIEEYQNTIDIYNDYAAKVEAFNQDPEGMATVLDGYEKDLAAALDAVEQAKIKLAALEVDNPDVYKDYADALNAYSEFKGADIEIPAYSVSQLDVLSVLNSAWSNPAKLVVVGENTNYTLEDPYVNSLPIKVGDAKDAFNLWIRDLTLAQFDKNDVKWTEARLIELDRQINQNEAFNKVFDEWTMAKNAYKMGDEPDASVLLYEKEVEEAIDAYNEYAQSVIDAKAAELTAYNEMEEASAAYDAAVEAYGDDPESVPGKFKTAIDAYETAESEAYTAYLKAIQDSSAALEIAKQKIEHQKKVLAANLIKAQIALAETEQDPKATADDIEDAKTGVQEAQTAYDEYVEDKVDVETGLFVNGAAVDLRKAQETKSKADAAAEVAQEKALYNANQALLKAEEEYLKAGADQLYANDDKYKPVQTAFDNYVAKQKAYQEASDNVDDINNLSDLWDDIKAAVEEQQRQLVNNWSCLYYDADYPYGAIPDKSLVIAYINSNDPEAEFPTADYPVMYKNSQDQRYTNARNYLIRKSYQAFGGLGWEYDINFKDPYNLPYYETYDWESDRAILLDVTSAEDFIPIMDEYITKIMIASNSDPYYTGENITPYMIADFYGPTFGAFGKMAAAIRDFSYAKICLTEETKIPEEIDALKEARDEMLATLEAKEEELNSLNADVQTRKNDVDVLESDAKNALTDAEKKYKIYNDIVNNGLRFTDPTDPENPITVPSLTKYVDDLRDKAIGKYDPEDGTGPIYGVDDILKALAGKIKQNESKLAQAQQDLEYYQYQLDQYESEDYAKVENPYKYEVENLKAEVEIAKARMEFYKQRYDELQAQYDAAKKSANYPD